MPDGGIDAAVEDNCAIPPSSFLRKGHVGYQIKAGENFEPWKDSQIRIALFGKEGRPAKANLGKSVRDCLEKNGTYVLVCTGLDLPRQQELETVVLLKRYFAKCGYRKAQVDVWSQNKLIGLLQRFPSLSLAVNGRGHLQFQTHKSWSQQAEMAKGFRAGQKQSDALDDLRTAVGATDAAVHIRVLGDPGVGKTRFVLEATGSDDLKSSVIYVSSGATFRNSELLNELLKDDNEFTAVAVIDECDRETRAEIWNKLRNRGPRIRLITIHSEPEETAGDTRYIPASELERSQISEILKEYGVPEDQTGRWAELCGGSPRVAHMVGLNLKNNPEDMLRSCQEVCK